MARVSVVALLALLVASGRGQSVAEGLQAIDECGLLVQAGNCVLFEFSGGRYVLADHLQYRVGDSVRVIGVLDPNCVTICDEGNGCIRGATLYDPKVFPCGTPIPNFTAEITKSVCTTVSGALTALIVVGLWATRRRQQRAAVGR